MAGKTTWLNNELTTAADQGMRVLKVVSKLDIRDSVAYNGPGGSTHHSGHKGLSDKIFFQTVNDLSEVTDPDTFNVIGVDEGQFYPDLYNVVKHWVDDLSIHVKVTGLDGDSHQQKFGQVLDLIPLSDDAKKMTGRCRVCLDELESRGFKGNIVGISAPFTKRIGPSTSQIDPGGSDRYIAVCRRHHA